MLRSHWDILFDFAVFLTGIVVLVYSAININFYNKLRNGKTGDLSQSQVDSMYAFSIVVAIWAAIVIIWAGWRLVLDVTREHRVLKVVQPTKVHVPAVTTTATVVPSHVHSHGTHLEHVPAVVQQTTHAAHPHVYGTQVPVSYQAQPVTYVSS